jgi:hypothetical protein
MRPELSRHFPIILDIKYLNYKQKPNTVTIFQHFCDNLFRISS